MQWVHRRFTDQARRTPDAVAAVLDGTGAALTYGALDERSDRVARRLRGLGAGRGEFVALCMDRSLELVVALIGALKAGCAYVPMDPAYPRERLAFMLDDVRAPLVLTQRHLAAGLPGAARPVFVDEPGGEVGEASDGALQGDDLAYVIYTSGSTGRPKGAMIHHAGLANYIDFAARRYEAGAGATPVHSSIGFDLTVTSLLAPLIVGGSLLLLAPDAGPGRLAELLRTPGAPSFVKLTPAHVALLRRTLRPEDVRSAPRVVVVGGEALHWPDVAYLAAMRPAPRIFNEYGPTETVVGCAVYEAGAGQGRTGAVQGRTGAVPIGRPIDGVQLHVLADRGGAAAVGEAGELCVGGVQVGAGYLRRPGLTADRFVAAVAAPVGRMYRTGDRARWSVDGQLEFLGRVDRQVKIRGVRVELGEIEAVLAEHPALVGAVVVVHADGLVAHVAARPAAERRGLVAAVREHLQARLPAAIVPGAVVVHAALPLTAHGKVDLAALPPPPTRGSGEPPRTPTERRLAALWSELLGIEDIGRDDEFVALGGHSLLAAELAARIGEAFAAPWTMDGVLARPTIAAMAAHLDADTGGDDGDDHAVPADGATPGQRRIWLLHSLGAAAAFNVPYAQRLAGALDLAALRAALQTVVDRHAPLRTTWSADGTPEVHRTSPLDVLLVDLGDGSADAQANELERRVQAEALRPFDLARDVLLRAAVLRLRPDEHVLLVTLHHIAADGWSLGVLERELSAAYAGTPLPPMPLLFCDYAARQARRATAAALAACTARLAGAPTELHLPVDRPRPRVVSYRGDVLPLALDAAVVRGLRALGQASGATLFMTLLAAFQVLLARHTGQDDVLVASPVADRPPGCEGLIGLLVHTLVLRADVSANPSFRGLLAQVRDTTLAAFAAMDAPLERLALALASARDPGRHPLFQAVFALQNAPRGSLELPGLRANPVATGPRQTSVDLELHLWPQGDALAGYWLVNADLFDRSTIARMSECLATLLAGLVADPDVRVHAAPLVPDGERRLLLTAWSGAAVPAPPATDVLARLAAHVERDPCAVALLLEDDDGVHTLTYGALAERVDRLADHLRARGIGPGSLVGLCAEPSFARVVALLAALRAGAAYLPLDPECPPARLHGMLVEARPACILTQADLAARLPDTPLVLIDGDGSPLSTPPATPPAQPAPGDLAYVLYTSGSTGRPKGTLVERGALANLVTAALQIFTPGPGDRVVQLAAPSFDVAALELWLALAAGATLCLADRGRLAPGEPLRGFLARHAVTQVSATPSTLAATPSHDLPALRLVNLGGEAPAPELVRRWSAGRRVYNSYGPTEATIWTTGSWCTDTDKPAAIGRPIAGARVYVLTRDDQPAPIGVTGELCIAGAGVARGYLGRPALTAEKFVADSFAPGRMYRTGDLARWNADGELEFIGRSDAQVKLRGVRVELGEVEAVLAEHPAVREARAVLREDTPGDPRLVAYFVPVPGSAASPEQLREHLRARLPDTMLPAAYVAQTALPRTPNGKLDLSALPAPAGAHAARPATRVAPRDPTEAVVARVWEDVLGVGPLGVHDDFFALGGHSLLVARVVSRLRDELALDMPLAALFQAPTVALLAGRIAAARLIADLRPAPAVGPRDEVSL